MKRQQADQALPVNNESKRKRQPAPSNISPLAQRMRSDFQIDESELDQVESPEKELQRSHPSPQSVPFESTPSVGKVLPAPAPLVFTPPKEPESPICLNCEFKMTPDHQCESGGDESEVIARVAEEEVEQVESVEVERVLEIESPQVESVEVEKVLETVESAEAGVKKCP